MQTAYGRSQRKPWAPSWLAGLLPVLLLTVAACTPAGAEGNTTPSSRQIVLGDNIATISLPSGFIFVPQDKAKEFLKQQGSSEEGVLGIIAPGKDSHDEYAVICRFEDLGYVKDDDAGKLNADEILNSYKEGNKQQNEERKSLNLPPIYVGHWAEKPHYDKSSHHVIWGIEVKDQDSDSAPVTGVNYNTRILGRKGVLSMNLVTNPQTLDADKVKVKELLADTTFNKGQSYADYVPGKDKSAGFGIAGLILGGGAMAAAAKFGLFGVMWKWILAAVLMLKKFIIVAVVAVAGGLSKLFGKKKTAAASVPPPDSPNTGT